MNERIKELAEQAGVTMQNIYPCYERDIERFAELVRQDEREACAKLCESLASSIAPRAEYCAELIRARDNHENAPLP